MIRRRKPLTRKTPLRRSGSPLRRTPIKRVSAKRREENSEYSATRKVYLFDHPLCQITIAEARLDERAVLKDLARQIGEQFGLVALQQGQPSGIWFGEHLIPWATEVHHRNKTRGARKLDQRFWMAASRWMHDKVEVRKDWARARGYLLPFEAYADGRLPNGGQCLETSELLRIRALGSDSTQTPPF